MCNKMFTNKVFQIHHRICFATWGSKRRTSPKSITHFPGPLIRTKSFCPSSDSVSHSDIDMSYASTWTRFKISWETDGFFYFFKLFSWDWRPKRHEMEFCPAKVKKLKEKLVSWGLVCGWLTQIIVIRGPPELTQPVKDLSVVSSVSTTTVTTSEVLQVHWCIHLWRHVGHTVIGVLSREPPDTLHVIGDGRKRGFRSLSQICLTIQGNTKLSPMNHMEHWNFVLVQKDGNAKKEIYSFKGPSTLFTKFTNQNKKSKKENQNFLITTFLCFPEQCSCIQISSSKMETDWLACLDSIL